RPAAEGKHHGTARTEVEVSRIQLFLIDRSEGVGQTAIFTQTDNGTSPPAAGRVIGTIGRLSQHTERSLHNPAPSPGSGALSGARIEVRDGMVGVVHVDPDHVGHGVGAPARGSYK